jgi:hypothetical protein
MILRPLSLLKSLKNQIKRSRRGLFKSLVSLKDDIIIGYIERYPRIENEIKIFDL